MVAEIMSYFQFSYVWNNFNNQDQQQRSCIRLACAYRGIPGNGDVAVSSI